MHRPGLATILCTLTACGEFEPPPDIDTETGTLDDEEGDEEVVFDGAGKGDIFPARLRDTPEIELDPMARYGLVIGAPAEDWEAVAEAGQASLLIDDGTTLAPPQSSPSTYVEGTHATGCSGEQRFAWDLLENRRFGGAASFFTRRLGGAFGEQENVPLVASPTAGAQSGRVMTWLRCFSCALFPKPTGQASVTGGRFGTAVAVAVVGSSERLVVGSPTRGDGVVGVLHAQSFRRWDTDIDWNFWGMMEGNRECQCELGDAGAEDCQPWNEELAGAYDDEQFGTALSAADFNCDGDDDLAVGAPAANLPTMDGDFVSAGAVYVYETEAGQFAAMPPTVLRQGTFEVGDIPEIDDRFGQTLLAGNFNGARRLEGSHSCYDLVVAAPGENAGAGQIQVFEGSPNGLLFGGPVFTLDDLFDGTADTDDRFGYAMTAGDFNRDGFDDLIVGAPGDQEGGSVWVIPGSPDGLAIDEVTAIRQGAPYPGGLYEGANELGDEFGYALSWTIVDPPRSGQIRVLAVGVPGEDAGAGQLQLFRAPSAPVDASSIQFSNFATLNQDDILGDRLSGDRFASVLMPARAFPRRPYEVIAP